MEETGNIKLSHGSGGRSMNRLIRDHFLSNFGGDIEFPPDSATVETGSTLISITTDSYVVDPIFFPGGDIGRLAVCGTVNDLAVSGAEPLFLTAAFIIEEGFPLENLKRIVHSMGDAAREAGIRIVAGDTKVVPRGDCDKIFINTTGVGRLTESAKGISAAEGIMPGDLILLNSPIASHGISILKQRKNIIMSEMIRSDSSPLNGLIRQMMDSGEKIIFMRDCTRGGLAATLCDLADAKKINIEILEEMIPVKKEVKAMGELYGFDLLSIANEGVFVTVCRKEAAEKLLDIMSNHKYGADASIIGEVTERKIPRVEMVTVGGGRRTIDIPDGDQLPRIC